MDYSQKILLEFELLSVEGIKECFNNGVSANDYVRGKPLINELISGYSRGPKFKECVKAFVDHGLVFDDTALLAIFLDDAISLDKQLSQNKSLLDNRYTLDCAFTSLYDVSLLHVCAEYNHIECAKVLVDHGANVNVEAGFDENGFGGQTPIFHTVNQNSSQYLYMMEYLISKSSNLNLTVKGLIWGENYQWETFIPSVNPISYAMMGLLPQFQRTESQIYVIISILLKATYQIDYTPVNVPNKYLED